MYVTLRAITVSATPKMFVYKKALDNYQELKVKLAAAYRLERGQFDSSSAKNSFKSDSLSQFGTSS